MRRLSFLVVGLVAWQIIAPAQTADSDASPDDEQSVVPIKSGVIGADAVTSSATYAPLTASERWRGYFISAYGPQAIVRAAASAGVSQWNNKPREWRQGSEAYGERFGSHLAEHVIRETMQSGAAAILHEDNRYFWSGDTGFGKRLMHAVSSVFVARNNAGQQHFAYSRVGSALGGAFISRIWQPSSEDTAGDAAVTFGLNMAVDIGWNVFREFCPKRLGRHF